MVRRSRKRNYSRAGKYFLKNGREVGIIAFSTSKKRNSWRNSIEKYYRDVINLQICVLFRFFFFSN